MSRVSHLDGHLVLGESSAPQQLVDAVNGQEARDVGTQAVGDGHPDGVGCDDLHTEENSASFFTTCTTVFHLGEALNEHLAKVMQCRSNHSFARVSVRTAKQTFFSYPNCFYSRQVLHSHKASLECSNMRHHHLLFVPLEDQPVTWKMSK